MPWNIFFENEINTFYMQMMVDVKDYQIVTKKQGVSSPEKSVHQKSVRDAIFKYFKGQKRTKRQCIVV